MLELIGWIGSACLALCGVPLLYSAIKDNSIAKNINAPFLILWFVGEVLILGYSAALNTDGEMLPYVFNYGFNIACILGILWLRWRTR